ncbi:MAG: hypothetical protein AAF642_18660 [Pseudomonadota bacterium]
MSAPQISLECYPFVVDLTKMNELMGSFGWRSATPEEIPELVALGEDLVNDRLADPATIERVHAATKITAWAFGDDPIEGMVLQVPLSELGLAALEANEFVPGNPDPAHIAAAGELCAACYIGIYAGATYEARKAVMTGAGVIRMGIFPQVPCFARAATDDGARSMESLGWAPAGFGPDKLWMQGAIQAPSKKVA